ncbi:MAG: RecX family transcriptional regulator [Candidatus Promineifilaceae bacterium]
MGKITALTRQKRNTDRVNVYLDGQFAFGVDAFVAISLKVGQTLTAEEINKLQAQDEVEKAKNTAIRLIEYRPRSIAEVKNHLKKKNYSDLSIEQAIERLIAVDLLNDEKFARYWLEQRNTFKPRSKIALQQELRQKGIDRTIIDATLDTLNEEDAARRAAQAKARRWKQLPEQDFKKKLGQYLQRQGFSYTIIRELTDSIWHDISSDDDVLL